LPWVGLTLESNVEHDVTGWPSAVHKVDPLARQVGKSSEVLGRCEPFRLEAPHLTRRSRAPLRRFAADNPAHRRIVAQALGVVHILVSGKATKYRLPEQPGQCVSTTDLALVWCARILPAGRRPLVAPIPS